MEKFCGNHYIRIQTKGKNKISIEFEIEFELQCETIDKIDGLVQNSSISSANALELLQFCTKPSRWSPGWSGWILKAYLQQAISSIEFKVVSTM